MPALRSGIGPGSGNANELFARSTGARRRRDGRRPGSERPDSSADAHLVRSRNGFEGREDRRVGKAPQWVWRRLEGSLRWLWTTLTLKAPGDVSEVPRVPLREVADK